MALSGCGVARVDTVDHEAVWKEVSAAIAVLIEEAFGLGGMIDRR